MRITFESNKTDNLMALKKQTSKLITIVAAILIVIKIVHKPLYIVK